MITLRPATPADAEAIATLDHTAIHTAMPTVAWKHPLPEVIAYVAGHMLPGGGLTVAEQDGVIVGYTDTHDGWIHQLHVHPTHWRQGIGSLLMAHAKAASPTGLQLWCMQVNARARAFYERHGFRIAETTDGSRNEEREPDIRYEWQGA